MKSTRFKKNPNKSGKLEGGKIRSHNCLWELKYMIDREKAINHRDKGSHD